MGGTADPRRLSVDDALAPIPAVREADIEQPESTRCGYAPVLFDDFVGAGEQ
jgi:hypothetical protein